MEVISKLNLFLYTGEWSERPYVYVAGSNPESVSTEFFAEVFSNETRIEEAVAALRKAKKEASISYPTVYALATLLSAAPKTDKPSKAHRTLYELVPLLLDDTKDLMLFNKIANQLGIKKGTMWQKCMLAWYANCDSEKLINQLMILHPIFGWTHKNVHDLLHTPPLNDVHKIYCTYIYEGLESVKKIENAPEDIVNKIKALDKLNKAKGKEFFKIINGKKFVKFQHIMHLPGLYSGENPFQIWKSIIDRLSINEILPLIKKLQSVKKKIKNSDKADEDYASVMCKIGKLISASDACPIVAFIAYSDYKNELIKQAKSTKNVEERETAIVAPENKEQKAQTQKKAPSENVVDANLELPLLSLVDRGLKTVECNVDISCVITIDMRNHMFESRKKPKVKVEGTGTGIVDIQTADKVEGKPAKCYNATSITPGHAGILLALYLTKHLNTIVGVFTNDLYFYYRLKKKDKVLSYEAAVKKLTDTSDKKPGKVSLNKPFEMSTELKKNVDLFVNVSDVYGRVNEVDKTIRKESSDVWMALSKYRAAMNKPNARAVTVCLSSSSIKTPPTIENAGGAILNIAGFDEHVPKIIKSFATGCI